MSKPIRITDKMRRDIQAEFSKFLEGMKMPNGKIDFSRSFEYKDASAVLWITALAYRKTVSLITEFSDEVAWHGIATKQSKNEFVIKDILVYPQEVTGSTVNSDQKLYTQWLYEFDDETFNNIRMQGHSHVNMGVSPSGIDDEHRKKILSQLADDMFYIFMIWNKQLNIHSLIYDMANNILYEDSDITVKIVGDSSLDTFIADAKEKIKRKKPAHYERTSKKKKEYPTKIQDSLWGRGYGLHDQMRDDFEL